MEIQYAPRGLHAELEQRLARLLTERRRLPRNHRARGSGDGASTPRH